MATLEQRLAKVLKTAKERRLAIEISIAPSGSWMFLLGGSWVRNSPDFEDGVSDLETRLGIESEPDINRDEENDSRWKAIQREAKFQGVDVTMGQVQSQPSIIIIKGNQLPRSLQGKNYEETLSLAEEALGIKK